MKHIFTKSLLFFTLAFFGYHTQSFGQFSISGQLGYASPQGDIAEYEGQEIASGGLSIDIDGLFHFEQTDYKLGAGLTYNSSLLFAAGEDASGIYGLSLYGVKGLYKFTDTDVAPYGSLSLGLGQLSTPTVTVDGQTTEGENAFSLGVRPEIGILFGGFSISFAYQVPMGYKFDGADESLSAGSMQFSIGYRYMNW